jgi:hypothetical protein
MTARRPRGKRARFGSSGDEGGKSMRQERQIYRQVVDRVGRVIAALAALASALAMIAVEPRSAGAQQVPQSGEPSPVLGGGPTAPPSNPPPSNPPLSGLQVTVTPYLWLAGIDSAISTPLARAPVVDSSVGAFQLLGHLDAVPFMGSLEISDGPFSLLGDAFHVPVGTSITTRNIFYSGGSAALIANQGTADFLYHAFADPSQSLDAGIGFRAWSFTADMTLNGRILRTISITRSAQWADPLLAARYHYDVGHGFGLTAYGDVGGFGVGAHTDWQVIGTIDYALKPWATLLLGYRSLNFDYTAASSVGFNVHMKGPLLAANFRF